LGQLLASRADMMRGAKKEQARVGGPAPNMNAQWRVRLQLSLQLQQPQTPSQEQSPHAHVQLRRDGVLVGPDRWWQEWENR